MRRKLKRKTFDEVIERNDFLKSEESYLNNAYSFHPAETPNRNPDQVPTGTWCRLIFKHLNKEYYN